MNKRKSIWNWVLPTALILFICAILTLPLILVLTYAGNSETATHTLELKDKRLYWDSDADVFEDGSAELSLFRSYYDNVRSDNSDHVVAPGTAADALLKFINKSGDTVTYYAYMYERKSDSSLPVTTKMTSSGANEVTEYPIPDLLKNETIITVLKGSATADTVTDFRIDWNWIFEVDDAQDVIDTYFGDKAAFDVADDMTVGFYFVVEADDGSIIPPGPQTGIDPLPFVVAPLAIAGVILIIAFVIRRRKNEAV